MLNEISVITKSLFQRENLREVGTGEMEEVIAKYPYFAPARILLAKKLFEEGRADDAKIANAGLYIHNPLLLDWLLKSTSAASANEPVTVAEVHEIKTDEPQPAEAAAVEKQVPVTGDAPITFQSYHTIDYFASQGIRLQQADLGKDRLGQQLKSFTEWLRSMKRLPASDSDIPEGVEDSTRHHNVMQSAAHSIEAKEILTEAMAEVWAKQGNAQKATAIYEKLSLQNPAKSDYFAAKIAQLKAL